MLAFADDPDVLLQIGRIVLLDLLLAGDNALVIAMAVRVLPPREQRLGRLWGTVGAVLLRIVFLALATWLLAMPLLRLGGGLLLLWIAYRLLRPLPHGPMPAAGTDRKPAMTLAQAVRIIVIADVSMSIDNVIAVTGAADGHLGLAVLGIALSIPLVIWGSAVLSRILQFHPWIVWLGGGVLGHVAGSLIVEDPQVAAWFGAVDAPSWHPLPIALAVALTAFGCWASRLGRRQPRQ
jgi:YjbE family integral membrane protein